MQLNQIFKMEFINAGLEAKNKDEVLAELVNVIIEGGLKLNSSSIIDILKQRENLGSTGIGEGVAIPHGKISNLNDIVVAFGRSEKGIAYDSLDGKPVHLFFLLLAPENSAGQHLKILAKISKMLKDVYFRNKLIAAKSRDELYQIIIDQERTCIV
ncbi:MAG TPA: PTS sugar transporter subunit IIA [Smithella sp.]|jgi:PTS system nitrogen regulatory IIA component|nr:PTS sugar transporter subunit IIA [Smithella sp.]NMC97626.1 PTS sugar transporter subunit IIA [Deltaproteobacteria bacterium]OQC53126.1 MAG: Nitrogen regulatory protein [Deltaproteobacteria bacterium ADurb.Bin022]HPH54473.1 PTS sugar transporter subunit IIA [Smithella sp.]HPK21350.1 PTS sugar transporter subunit IIA [Smithella sp.]